MKFQNTKVNDYKPFRMKQLEEYTVQFGWDEYGSFAHKKTGP